MARLAFFTERLPSSDRGTARADESTEFSFDLMMSLADQQHDVRVFSTYREEDLLPAPHPRLQIIRPFRRWGWLEIPRLIPILLDFQPEILHFIQPRDEVFRGLTNAMTALPTLGPLIGRPRMIVSLYDLRITELHRNKSLLAMADTVIVANRHQANELKAWLGEAESLPEIEIVSLPSSEAAPTSEREVLPGLEHLQEIARDLLFLPGELKDQSDLESLAIVINEVLSAVPTAGVIFGGGWGDLPLQHRRNFIRHFEDRGHGARLLLTGPLSPAAEQTCLRAASLVVLSGLADSSLALARWIRLGLRSSKPLVLSEQQCRLDPMAWRHGENAFVVGDDPHTWGQPLALALLDEPLRRELSRRLPEFTRTEAVDHPGNTLSRIYASRLLRPPRKPLR